MSAPAAAAMREVLVQLLQLRAVNDVDVAFETASKEAGMKLRNNHACVLKDVCNPTPTEYRRQAAHAARAGSSRSRAHGSCGQRSVD